MAPRRGEKQILGTRPRCNCSSSYKNKMASQSQVNLQWEEQEEEVGRGCQKDVQTEE